MGQCIPAAPLLATGPGAGCCARADAAAAHPPAPSAPPRLAVTGASEPPVSGSGPAAAGPGPR